MASKGAMPDTVAQNGKTAAQVATTVELRAQIDDSEGARLAHHGAQSSSQQPPTFGMMRYDSGPPQQFRKPGDSGARSAAEEPRMPAGKPLEKQRSLMDTRPW